MRRAFGKLMDLLEERDFEGHETLGAIAEQYGEPVGRIMDALDANKERRGERSYIDAAAVPEP